MVLMFSALLFVPDMPDRRESMAAVPHDVSKSNLAMGASCGSTAASGIPPTGSG
jgi:hypothetical protein